MITYSTGTMPNITAVRLDGILVGVIREFKTEPKGFRYEPKGNNAHGALFQTLAACKSSLEAL
jgi:hypothetical protein